MNEVKEIIEIIEIAKKYNLSADKLIQEADCVETFGQYLHCDFMGYRPKHVREAAAQLRAAS